MPSVAGRRAEASAIAGAARRAAKALGAQGEGGDEHLIHVDDGELAAIRGASGRSGRAGRRNRVTGLESFAPEEEAIAGAGFMHTNSGESGNPMPLPLDRATAEAADAGCQSLSKITPAGLNQSSPPHDQTLTGLSALREPPGIPVPGEILTRGGRPRTARSNAVQHEDRWFAGFR